jgi:hypothetical protein
MVESSPAVACLSSSRLSCWLLCADYSGRLTHLPLSPIRCMAYFQPVIAELLSNPAPENYLDYLRFKLHRIATGKSTGSGLPPADVQKTTFSDDR